MSFLFVYLNLKNEDGNKIKLEFNDSNISSIIVKDLKNKLSDQQDLPRNYDLTFFGRCLKDDNQLSTYGIKSGASLFLLPNLREDEVEMVEKPKLEQKELEKMIVAIRTALFNVKFRQMLNQLYDKEFRENLVACVPDLKKNIIAFTILLDPELMMICSEKDNLTQFSKKLSVFVEAATHLACAFHEESVASSSQSNSSNSNTIFGQNAYSLDTQSDDELDVAQPNANQQVRETQPIIQNNRITTDMLSAAISAANTSSSLNSNPSLPSTSRQLNQSLTSTATNSTSSNQAITKDWSKELETMREFGFKNDVISRQALEVTNGNVEQAINFYLILDNQGNN